MRSKPPHPTHSPPAGREESSFSAYDLSSNLTVITLLALTALPSRVAGLKRHLDKACDTVTRQNASLVAERHSAAVTRPSAAIDTRTVAIPSRPARRSPGGYVG